MNPKKTTVEQLITEFGLQDEASIANLRLNFRAAQIGAMGEKTLSALFQEGKISFLRFEKVAEKQVSVQKFSPKSLTDQDHLTLIDYALEMELDPNRLLAIIVQACDLRYGPVTNHVVNGPDGTPITWMSIVDGMLILRPIGQAEVLH